MKCSLCPNACSVDKSNTAGLCATTDKLKIAKFYLHPYEEPIISGNNGSGTIFLCGCSLKCVFCQNYPVSRNKTGKFISVNELADIFRQLEDLGAHNINLVNPTHYSNKIIEALDIYRPNIPIVYNTHGYEKVEVLKKINDYVDVYLPDMKFYSPNVSYRYTGKKDYFEVAKKALEFMADNKPIAFDKDGLLKSGTLVRHLVLPQNTSDSRRILDWFATIKEKAYINLMSQYTPFGEIEKYPELQRKLTTREYDTILDYAISLDIKNMFYQKLDSSGTKYIPKWDF